MADLKNHFVTLGDFHNGLGIFVGRGQGLFHEHVHTAFEERARHMQVMDGGHHDADRIDFTQQVLGLDEGPAGVFLGDAGGRLRIGVHHTDQFHSRHGGINARVKLSQIPDSDYTHAHRRGHNTCP